MSQTEYLKFLQVAIATWGLFSLVVLFAPRQVLEALTRGRVPLSRGIILFFRLAGAVSLLGACSRLFFWHG